MRKMDTFKQERQMQDDYDRLLALHKRAIEEKQIEINKLVGEKVKLTNEKIELSKLINDMICTANCGYRGKCTMKCPCPKWTLYKKEGA